MNERTRYLIGLAIAGLVIIGLLVWYMATHPAPTPGLGAQPDQDAEIVQIEQYVEVRARYPKTVTLPLARDSQAGAEAARTMETWVNQEIMRFRDNAGIDQLTPEDIALFGLDQGRKYALTIAYEAFSAPATVSYDYQIFADTLGAHPNTYYRTFTFDAATGDLVGIGDLFIPGADYLDRLSTIARAKLPAMIAEREQVSVDEVQTDFINDGTQPIEDSFQNFYLDGTDLVLVFPPYQVGPYVLGLVLLPIPRAELADILKPAYQ